MAAPKITARRVAAGLTHGVNDGIGGLDALGLIQLAKIIPGREKNQPVEIANHKAFGIAVVAED